MTSVLLLSASKNDNVLPPHYLHLPLARVLDVLTFLAGLCPPEPLTKGCSNVTSCSEAHSAWSAHCMLNALACAKRNGTDLVSSEFIFNYGSLS